MDTRSKALSFALILFFFTAATWVKVQTDIIYPVARFKKPEPEAYPWDPKWFRFITMGEWITGLDVLWLRTVQDPRIDHVKKGEHPWSFYDYDLITDLDPAYGEVYYHGAMSLVVIRNDVPGGLHLLEKANRFMKRVLPTLPEQYKKGFWEEGWFIPLRLAYVYLFELDHLPRAAEYYRQASEMVGSPPYLQNLVKRFDRRDGMLEVGIRLLRVLEAGASTPEIKEKLTRRLNVLIWKLVLKQWSDQWKMDHRRKSIQQFKIEKQIPEKDPFGGRVLLNSEGKWISDPPLEKVLGL